MTRRQQLEQQDKASLIEGYVLLEQRVRSLEQQLNDLKQLLGKRVLKTSANSSLPPAQEQKANVRRKKQAKRGAKPGHPGRSRKRQAPDEIIECRVSACGQCGQNLTALAQHEVGRHQVIDVPPIRPLVYEVVRYGRYCPGCGSYERAAAPSGFETGRVLGPHIETLVLYLHAAHPLSYQRIQHILADVCGLKLSPGALVNAVARARPPLKAGAQALRQHIRRASVVGSDETTTRVNGVTHWQWVFQTPQWVYHTIQATRSAQVVRQVLGKSKPQVWVSDLLTSQLKHPARAHQVCLAHQVRDLQYLIETQRCIWAWRVQRLLYQAIRLVKYRTQLAPHLYRDQVQAVHQRMDALLQHYPVSKDSRRLWRRLRKHRAALFVFLERSDVPPTNNAAEQALRNSVIYRKVTGGFRSRWGAELYANLISILESARRQGRSLFETLQMILAPQPDFSWIAE